MSLSTGTRPVSRTPKTSCENRERLHGWCVLDMPLQNGMPIYSKPDAERASGKLVKLHKAALEIVADARHSTTYRRLLTSWRRAETEVLVARKKYGPHSCCSGP